MKTLDGTEFCKILCIQSDSFYSRNFKDVEGYENQTCISYSA